MTIVENLAVVGPGGTSGFIDTNSNGSAAPSGGGGAGGVLEVLMLDLTLLTALFKARAPATAPVG